MELKINFTGMDISLYIAEILEDHGKVTIPGIGTFHSKKIAAYFDEQQQMFFPPSREITFEESEDEDEEFAGYISKAENIPEAYAEDIIREFTGNVSKELESSGSAEVPGIGKLKKEGSQYTVESFSSFGLQPLPELESVSGHTAIPGTVYEDIPGSPENELSQNLSETEKIAENNHGELENISEPEKISENNVGEFENIAETERVAESESEFENPFQAAAETDEIEGDNNEISEDRLITPVKKWLLIAIPVVILLLISSLLYFFYPQIEKFVQNNPPENPQTEQEVNKIEPLPQDAEDSIAYSQLEQRIAPAKPPDTTASVKPAATVRSPGTYEIVIASFGAQSEAEASIKRLTAKGSKAEAYINQLKNKGLNLRLVEKPSGLYKYQISAGPFKDNPSANMELPSIQKNLSKTAWIDVPKNKTK